MADDVLHRSLPPGSPVKVLAGPVRRAFRLVVAAAALLGGQALTALVLLVRFDTAYLAHAPWSVGEQSQIDSMHTRLALTVVLSAGVVVLLAGVAMAIPRRSVGTRGVVGFAALLTGVMLLLGVVINPDNALLASGPAEEEHLYHVLPLWFSVLSSTAVTGVLGCLIRAFLLMGREEAHDYYHYQDPAAGWDGFNSWWQVTRDR